MSNWSALNKHIDFVTWANTLLDWTSVLTWAGLFYWNNETKH